MGITFLLWLTAFAGYGLSFITNIKKITTKSKGIFDPGKGVQSAKPGKIPKKG